MPGPLAGVRVVELASIGPIPFCGMVLSDMGCDIVRVDKLTDAAMADPSRAPGTVLDRGRRSIALDLKSQEGREVVLRLVDGADVLIEGYRPGVAERLGVGPDACLARNPRLVYGRMTGWGQDGPLATTAGHDLGYIAITGALHAMGQDPTRPHFPSNLVGDFGGGSTYLVIGILAALLEARLSGRGQVVDAAIVDGTAHLNAMATGFWASGLFREERAANLLDGGAPFYDVYATSDGGAVSVGCLEPSFYAELMRLLDLERPELADHMNPECWPAIRAALEETFATRTRDEWEALFAGSETCVAPVLDLDEAPLHPQSRARASFYEDDRGMLPMPAPRFGRTPAAQPGPTSAPGADTESALAEWGFADTEIRALLEDGIAHSADAR